MTKVFATLGDEHTFTVATLTVSRDRAGINELIRWFEANGYASTKDGANSHMQAVHLGVSWAEGPGWRIDTYFWQYRVQIADEQLAMLFSLRWM